MNRLLSGVLLFAVIAVVSFGSDATLQDGIPGAYSRLLGMEATIVELRRDGVYVITTQGCVWSEEGKGRWAVRDGLLLLDGRGHPKEKKDRLTRFEVVVVDGDLALRPLNDEVELGDREAEVLLFRPLKKTANSERSDSPERESGRRLNKPGHE